MKGVANWLHRVARQYVGGFQGTASKVKHVQFTLDRELFSLAVRGNDLGEVAIPPIWYQISFGTLLFYDMPLSQNMFQFPYPPELVLIGAFSPDPIK